MTKKIIITGTDVNMRAGPGLAFNIVGKGRRDETYDWLRTDNDGSYDWYGNAKGWTRSDLSKIVDDAVGGAGVIVIGENNVPQLLDYWHLNYTVKGTFTGGWGDYDGEHRGWDIANRIGTPIFGVLHGKITERNWCSKCGSPGASSLGNPVKQVYIDQGWQYGWGHNIVVEYASHLLPLRTQQMFPNQSAYVLYGHLTDQFTKAMMVDGVNPIAFMGNSGNSSGPHLHIEVRFSVGTGQAWRRIGPSVDPGVLFTR